MWKFWVVEGWNHFPHVAMKVCQAVLYTWISRTPLCFLLKTWRLFEGVRFYCSQQRDRTHLSFECMACQGDCSLCASVFWKVIASLICGWKTNIQIANRKFQRKLRLWSLISNRLILFPFFVFFFFFLKILFFSKHLEFAGKNREWFVFSERTHYLSLASKIFCSK